MESDIKKEKNFLAQNSDSAFLAVHGTKLLIKCSCFLQVSEKCKAKKVQFVTFQESSRWQAEKHCEYIFEWGGDTEEIGTANTFV